MDDLITFITARLAEDEAAAKEAAAENAAGWFTGPSEEYDERSVLYNAPSTLYRGSTWDYSIAGRVPQAAAAHIVLHDPARVLREVAAKRAILALHAAVPVRGIDAASCQQCRLIWPCPTLRQVIAVWSDHPDYRQEWAVTAGSG